MVEFRSAGVLNLKLDEIEKTASGLNSKIDISPHYYLSGSGLMRLWFAFPHDVGCWTPTIGGVFKTLLGEQHHFIIGLA